MPGRGPLYGHGSVIVYCLAGAAVVAVAATWYTRRSRNGKSPVQGTRSARLRELLEEYRQSLDVSSDVLRTVCDDVVKQFNTTLSGKEQSTILMLPSMVDELPNGFESGEYFALDMGGTNFRTVYVNLSDRHGEMDDLKMEEFPIEASMHHTPADELFDFMANKLVDFANHIGKKPKPGKEAVVGFCFSFPLHQHSVNHGTLIKWNKGFTNANAVDKDPTDLLEAALARQGMKARVMSLVNDTVSTLAACRYKDQDTMLGVILGTGSNGAYVESSARIHNASRELPKDTHMIINCEWGNYTAEQLPMLSEDLAIDAESSAPGNQHLEKMTAGLYMGEIARKIILRLAEEGGLFGKRIPAGLKCKRSLTTPQMSKIDHDTSTDLLHTADILQEAFGLDVDQITFDSTQVVQEICHLVGWRAGRLKAAAIAAVMKQLKRDDGTRTVVGVDGGVFEHYANYRDAMKAGLLDILGKKAADAVEFQHVADGSSLGAAYLAAAAERVHNATGSNNSDDDDDLGKENIGKENRISRDGPSTPNKNGGGKSKNGDIPSHDAD